MFAVIIHKDAFKLYEKDSLENQFYFKGRIQQFKQINFIQPYGIQIATASQTGITKERFHFKACSSEHFLVMTRLVLSSHEERKERIGEEMSKRKATLQSK